MHILSRAQFRTPKNISNDVEYSPSMFDSCQITGSQYRCFKLSIRNHFCFILFDSVDKGKKN